VSDNKNIAEGLIQTLFIHKDIIEFYRLAEKYGFLDKKDLLEIGILI